MKIVIEVPEAFEAQIRGQALPVNVTKIHADGLVACFEYGLQRILNDASAAPLYLNEAGEPEQDREKAARKNDKIVRRPEADVLADNLAFAEKKLAALYEGTVRERVSRIDPTLKAARDLLVKILVKRKVKDVPKINSMDVVAGLLKQHKIPAKAFNEQVAAKVAAEDVSDLI